MLVHFTRTCYFFLNGLVNQSEFGEAAVVRIYHALVVVGCLIKIFPSSSSLQVIIAILCESG